MKKKRGFTLVELVAVIAILAIVMSIVIISVNTLKKQVDKKSIVIYKENVLSAANGFTQEYSTNLEWVTNKENNTEAITCIDIDKLVEYGFLEKDKTGNDSEIYNIKVTKNEISVTTYDLIETNECENYLAKNDSTAPTIECYNEEAKVEIKKDVTIDKFAKLSGTGSKIKEKTITLKNNNGDKITNTSTKDLGLGEYKVEYLITDAAGNEGNGTCTLKIVDTLSPIVILSSNPTDWTKENVITTIQATDSGSGIKEYKINKNQNYEIEDGTLWIQYSGNELTTTKSIEENGNYYIHIKDKGNNVTSQEISIENIDKIIPEITTLSQSVENWSIATIKIEANDKQSGISKYAISSNNDSSSITANDWVEHNDSTLTHTITTKKNGTYYAHIIDKVGNKTVKQVTISEIDTTPPEIIPDLTDDDWKVYCTGMNNCYPRGVRYKDDLSGVKEKKYYVSTIYSRPTNNNENFKTWDDTFAMNCSNNFHIYTIAIDNADNISEVTYIGAWYYQCEETEDESEDDCLSSESNLIACMKDNSHYWYCDCQASPDKATCQNGYHANNEDLAAQANEKWGLGLTFSGGYWYKNGNKYYEPDTECDSCLASKTNLKNCMINNSQLWWDCHCGKETNCNGYHEGNNSLAAQGNAKWNLGLTFNSTDYYWYTNGSRFYSIPGCCSCPN